MNAPSLPCRSAVESAIARSDGDADTSVSAGAVFLAMLSPMLTVSSLRRLLMEGHGTDGRAVPLFVSLGMLGAAIGAPLVARFADRRQNHVRLAAALATVDAVVTLATVLVPTVFVFLLRPIHGAASMGVVALLLGRFRGSPRALASRAGAALIAALAVGPALGGILGRGGYERTFGAAAACTLCLASLLAMTRTDPVGADTRTAPRPSPPLALARRALAPLVVLGTQRFALGALVGAFAVHARQVYGISDALVGASFSVLLIAFAVVTYAFGRQRKEGSSVREVLGGATGFAIALFLLAVGGRWILPIALLGAGVGAGLVYAPSLARVAAIAPANERASAMALVHAAGAVGMIAGPLAAAALELVLRHSTADTRAAVTLVLGGLLQLLAAAAACPHFHSSVAAQRKP